MHLQKQAFTVAEFTECYGLGRTKFYEEVKAGRLRIRKVGKRSLISASDAKEWFDSLPVAA
ncbi:MAG: DNA-binding protein [Rhizobiaceae bacterium]